MRHGSELIPLYEAEPSTAKRKPKALQQKEKAADDGKTRTLDRFAFKPKTSVPDESGGDGTAQLASIDEGAGDEDVVMNEDGTMTLDSL